MGRSDSSRRSCGRGWSNKNKSGERSSEKRSERSASKERERDRRRNDEKARQAAASITRKELAESADAIREFKAKDVSCELCGQSITDITAAIANRGSGKPVHFDCVLAKLSETEHIGQNDKITYIGQGKFAVLHFENIHDMRHFTIKREIEWEARDKERHDWRNEIAGLYSQVK